MISSAIKQPDETVNGADCYVLSHESNVRTETLWIGKKDYLLRQVKMATSAQSVKKVMEDELKKHPEIAPIVNSPKLAKEMASGDIQVIEMHSNIVVNQAFSRVDFTR